MNNLKKHFSDIGKLYGYQEDSLKKILSGKNALTIAPTGGGKSLIFQLAALELGGTTIVVSPLKALMDEQIKDLQQRGVQAIQINSDIPFIEQRKILRNLHESKPQLIYVSPERLSNYFFRSALGLSNLDIKLVVIDEAHCISQWGHDFRPDYCNILPFVKYIRSAGNTPVVYALTATLGEKAREDIKKEFDISNEDEIISKGVIRKNINMSFVEVDKEDSKWEKMTQFIEVNNLKKVLVYLYSRKKAENFAEQLVGSDYFHAFMTAERKESIMENFKKGNIKVLFATTAFGMGINIPDIDGVIHYQLPGSIEEYYQHVGRGARNITCCPDCKCLLLWSATNFDREAGNIRGDTLTGEKLNKGLKHLGLENKAGKKSYIRWEEIYNNDGSYGSVKLPLILKYFTQYKICDIVGDIYGNPQDIVFKRNTDLWNKVLHAIGIRNQFIIAEKKSGIPMQELIDHVYQEELKGNIDKLPAKDRLLFLYSYVDSLPDETINKIVEDSKRIEEFKLLRLKELQYLCETPGLDPHQYIADVLKVPYC